jgi:hypothetical protein
MPYFRRIFAAWLERLARSRKLNFFSSLLVHPDHRELVAIFFCPCIDDIKTEVVNSGTSMENFSYIVS